MSKLSQCFLQTSGLFTKKLCFPATLLIKSGIKKLKIFQNTSQFGFFLKKKTHLIWHKIQFSGNSRCKGPKKPAIDPDPDFGKQSMNFHLLITCLLFRPSPALTSLVDFSRRPVAARWYGGIAGDFGWRCDGDEQRHGDQGPPEGRPGRQGQVRRIQHGHQSTQAPRELL